MSTRGSDFSVAHVELGLRRVLPRRLMVVNDLAVGVGEPERSEVARLERLDAIGRVLGDIARVEDRVVHDDQAAAAARLRIGGDPNGIDHVEVAVGADRR